MATSKTAKASYTSNVMRDGLRLLQTFTTGGTAQSPKVTAITQATLDGLSGVMSLGAGDGVRLIFYATNGATAMSAKLLAYEPVVGSGGGIEAYVEIPVMVGAAALAKTGTAITAGAALNSAISGVPSDAESIDTISGWTASQMGLDHTEGVMVGGADLLTVYPPAASGGIAWIDYRPAQGITHIRVLLSCATASKTVYCLARRLQGQSLRMN